MARELDATESELRRALAEAMHLVPDDDPDVFTVRELAELLDVSEWNARKKANEAVEAGRMERVKVRRRIRNGRVTPLTGYRLVADWQEDK